MKITEAKLRKVIREEVRRMNEGFVRVNGPRKRGGGQTGHGAQGEHYIEWEEDGQTKRAWFSDFDSALEGRRSKEMGDDHGGYEKDVDTGREQAAGRRHREEREEMERRSRDGELSHSEMLKTKGNHTYKDSDRYMDDIRSGKRSNPTQARPKGWERTRGQ